MAADWTQAEAHFAFGRNWAEYADKIVEQEIVKAQRGLDWLLSGERLDGMAVMNIFIGAGIEECAA